MKFCPMCGMSQWNKGATSCEYCEYIEKDFALLTPLEIGELMSSYDYTVLEDGVRINSVKNGRDISLRGAVAIPSFVVEIGREAFAGCKFISRLDLPKSLRSIGDRAFAWCRDLFDVFIPESVEHIGKEAFLDCYDLGVVCVASPSLPDGWDTEWLEGCDARVEWSSTDE